jgi:spectrin alpha
MSSLNKEAQRLRQMHPDRADAIVAKMNEAESQWGALKRKAAERKAGLDRSYNMHRFFSDYRDLVSWINDMKAVISADELAKDVAGAEALLESHQEHRVTIF